MITGGSVCLVQTEHLNSSLYCHDSTCNAVHMLAVPIPTVPHALNSHMQC